MGKKKVFLVMERQTVLKKENSIKTNFTLLKIAQMRKLIFLAFSPPYLSNENIHKMTRKQQLDFMHSGLWPCVRLSRVILCQTCRDRVAKRNRNNMILRVGLVPDCSEYKKRRKLIIIQRCEKAKKLNVISTSEVLQRIENSKHNRHLRLPCAKL